MVAKKMVEYSISVPADSNAFVSVNHTPHGTVGTIETEDGRYDWGRREYQAPEEE
ncbi:hypothetical protein [Streptomyces sp. NPDC096068]|uniref:hypothetical protein n=1 Tax=Streptomyces sp. NPDC096068 TaxID=3155424 RepID=UPI0033230CC8